MTIKEKLDHACEWRYPVQITIQGREPFIGSVTYCIAKQCCIVVNNGIGEHGRHIHFDDVIDIRFVGEEAEEKMSFIHVKEVILKAFDSGWWVSILHGDRCKSISGSIRRHTPISVIIGPNEVQVFYEDIDSIYSFDPTGQKEEPEPPAHDIASERWEVDTPIEGYEGILRIMHVIDGETILAFKDADLTPSPERIRLMTAAPELADLARDFLNECGKQEKFHPDICFAMTELLLKLREIGVPNVAPWYAGGRNDVDVKGESK